MTRAATWPAVSQWRTSASSGHPVSRDTATPRQPRVDAVSAAPTVPEWRMAWPVLRPRLIPDRTRSGGGPNAPRTASSEMNPGAAANP